MPTDLTYDRGLLASAEVGGFDVIAEVMNGNGIGPADDTRRFDNDAGKVFFGRLSRDLAGWLRLQTVIRVVRIAAALAQGDVLRRVHLDASARRQVGC